MRDFTEESFRHNLARDEEDKEKEEEEENCTRMVIKVQSNELAAKWSEFWFLFINNNWSINPLLGQFTGVSLPVANQVIVEHLNYSDTDRAGYRVTAPNSFMEISA